MKKTKIIIKGSNNTIDLGKTSYLIHTKITIKGNNNNIILGERVYANDADFYFEDNDNILQIGNRTTFAGKTHLALTEGKKISIGNECLFSSNVVFRTGDSHSILNEKGERTNFAKDIEVENHVWFTQNTTVLKGTKIKENSIVATGAIVTKEVEKPNVIIAGNPAKIIKENINWNKERI